MKSSLLTVSLVRLAAVRYPYIYLEIITKRSIAMMLTIIWIFVLIVDVIPYLHLGKIQTDEGCAFNPSEYWAIAVVFIFDIVPFISITTVHVIIWKSAFDINKRDILLKGSLRENLTEVINNQHVDSLNEGEVHCTSTKSSENLIANTESCVAKSKPYILDHIDLTDNMYHYVPTEEVSEFLEISDENDNIKMGKRSKQKLKIGLLRSVLEMKATKTTLLLLLVYIICWLPSDISAAIEVFCSHFLHKTSSKYYLNEVTRFSSSILLPLVYCWRTKEFMRETCRFIRRKRYRNMWLRSFLEEMLVSLDNQYVSLIRDIRSRSETI